MKRFNSVTYSNHLLMCVQRFSLEKENKLPVNTVYRAGSRILYLMGLADFITKIQGILSI